MVGSLPLVTVVIATDCTAQRASAIERALDSLRAQRGVRVQPLLIVNGQRYSPALLERLKADPWLRVHYVEQGGFANALGIGRSLISSEFFSFLDDDDEYLPDTLALRVGPLLQDPSVDVVVANGRRREGDHDVAVYQNLPRDMSEAMEQFLRQNWLASCGGLFRAASVGLDAFEGLVSYFEWTLIGLRLLLARKNLVFLDIPVFRIHPTPQSLSRSSAYEAAGCDFLDGLLLLALPAALRVRVKESLAVAYNTRSLVHLRSGELLSAWRWHLRTLVAPGGWRYLPYTLRLSTGVTRRAARRADN